MRDGRRDDQQQPGGRGQGRGQSARRDQGDELVSSSTLYGGTHTMFAAILPDAGITTRFVDIHDFDAVRAAINERTRLIYTEVIGNPALDVAKIGRASCRERV